MMMGDEWRVAGDKGSRIGGGFPLSHISFPGGHGCHRPTLIHPPVHPLPPFAPYAPYAPFACCFSRAQLGIATIVGYPCVVQW